MTYSSRLLTYLLSRATTVKCDVNFFNIIRKQTFFIINLPTKYNITTIIGLLVYNGNKLNQLNEDIWI